MEDIKEKQAKLLELLKRFDAFAKEYNIKYFAAAGTCLGAVREKGFIPWDGDVDLLFPKPEYDRMENILKETKVQGIQWLSYKSGSDAPNLMGRIYGDKIDMEHLDKYPYIDLFALVGLPEKQSEQKRMLWIEKQNYRLYWVKKRKYGKSLDRKKSKIGIVLQKLLALFPSKLCIHMFEKHMNTYPYSNSKCVAPLTGLYGLREVFPKQWFDAEPEMVDFCDMKLPVVKNWDGFLRTMYGNDYMIPRQFNRYKEEK